MDAARSLNLQVLSAGAEFCDLGRGAEVEDGGYAEGLEGGEAGQVEGGGVGGAVEEGEGGGYRTFRSKYLFILIRGGVKMRWK